MKRWLLCLALLPCLSPLARAASFVFDGTIAYNTDKVFIDFGLDHDGTNIRIWTDSFMNGQNFDPVSALWTGDGLLLAQNDDNPNVGPGQTYFDTGMVIPFLAAGRYMYSVQVYYNFAIGPTLADGFVLDGTQPVPIEDWWTQGAGYWRLNLEAVDTAGPVPEAAPAALLAFGLAALAGAAALRRHAQGFVRHSKGGAEVISSRREGVGL